jgi:hypothetical protein
MRPLCLLQCTQQVVRSLLDNLADRMESLAEQNGGVLSASTLRKVWYTQRPDTVRPFIVASDTYMYMRQSDGF